MQGSQILEILKEHPLIYSYCRGIVSIDRIPRVLKYRHYIICNSDVESGNGKHWFCFLRNHHQVIEVFDSLGIYEQKIEQLKKYCKFTRLEFCFSQLQPSNSNKCGLYVLYYLLERMNNLDLDFEHFMEVTFSSNPEENEKKIEVYFSNNDTSFE